MRSRCHIHELRGGHEKTRGFLTATVKAFHFEEIIRYVTSRKRVCMHTSHFFPVNFFQMVTPCPLVSLNPLTAHWSGGAAVPARQKCEDGRKRRSGGWRHRCQHTLTNLLSVPIFFHSFMTTGSLLLINLLLLSLFFIRSLVSLSSIKHKGLLQLCCLIKYLYPQRLPAQLLDILSAPHG